MTLGYGTNSLYTRLKPTTRGRMMTLGVLIAGYRMWVHAWLALARNRSRTGPAGS